MYIFVSILILVISVLLGLIVLVQNPKGGGLAANFTGSGSQFMGVRQTADFLEKATWSLAIALLVLSLTATMIIPRGTESFGSQDSELKGVSTQPHLAVVGRWPGKLACGHLSSTPINPWCWPLSFLMQCTNCPMPGARWWPLLLTGSRGTWL